MDIQTVLKEKKALVDRTLDACLPAAGYAPRLKAAMRYSVFAGGKRIRPILAILAYEATGGADPGWVLPAACGLELIHTYSLIHDDLPCMDNDDLRRGKPTAHQAFDEATAILAGDALFALAFELFGRGPAPVERKFRVVQEMAEATGPEGIVGGQMIDISREKTIGPRELRHLHRHKTARFIAAALVTGAILAGADAPALDLVARAGTSLGMMFQITDDILDLTAPRDVLGKTGRKDVQQDKLTYPRLYGLDGARFRARAYGARACAHLARLGPGFEPVALVADYILGRGN